MSQPEADDTPKPARRRPGCLWGCLGVFLLVVVLAAGGIWFTAWKVYREFQNDTQLTAILDAVRSNPRAEAILGRDFRVMEIERHTFPMPKGKGHAQTYRLVLIGGGGESQVDVRLEPSKSGMSIVMMQLTAPNGQVIWLMGPGTAYGSGSI